MSLHSCNVCTCGHLQTGGFCFVHQNTKTAYQYIGLEYPLGTTIEILQAENKKLRAALEKILDVNGYDDWGDANKIAIEALK